MSIFSRNEDAETKAAKLKNKYAISYGDDTSTYQLVDKDSGEAVPVSMAGLGVDEGMFARQRRYKRLIGREVQSELDVYSPPKPPKGKVDDTLPPQGAGTTATVAGTTPGISAYEKALAAENEVLRKEISGIKSSTRLTSRVKDNSRASFGITSVDTKVPAVTAITDDNSKPTDENTFKSRMGNATDRPSKQDVKDAKGKSYIKHQDSFFKLSDLEDDFEGAVPSWENKSLGFFSSQRELTKVAPKKGGLGDAIFTLDDDQASLLGKRGAGIYFITPEEKAQLTQPKKTKLLPVPKGAEIDNYFTIGD